MDLLKALLYKTFSIETYDLETLKKILNKKNPDIKIKTVNHGSIILSDRNGHKIIKCIEKYYLTTDGSKLSSSQIYNFCWKNRTVLKLNCVNNDCVNCHLQCIELYNKGLLKRRKSK